MVPRRNRTGFRRLLEFLRQPPAFGRVRAAAADVVAVGVEQVHPPALHRTERAPWLLRSPSTLAEVLEVSVRTLGVVLVIAWYRFGDWLQIAEVLVIHLSVGVQRSLLVLDVAKRYEELRTLAHELVSQSGHFFVPAVL